jgi:hypothetical protein
MRKTEKLILQNQMLMMRSISAILHAPGVSAGEGKKNLHTLLREAHSETKKHIAEMEKS